MMDEDSVLEMACSLSSADYGARIGEFKQLFTSLTAYHPLSDGLHLIFDRGNEASARDLFRREAECCAFFSFVFSNTADGFEVAASAPPEAVACLVELEQLARDALAARS